MQEKQCKPPRPPLRTSCDTCHQSKVKCVSKSSATSCDRCEIRQIPCKRSPHRPFGRTPKNRRKRSISAEVGLEAFVTDISQSPTLGERSRGGAEDSATQYDNRSSPSDQPSQSLSPSDLHAGWELLFADTDSSMLDSAALTAHDEMIFAGLDPPSATTKYSESPLSASTSARSDSNNNSNSTAPCACASSIMRASSGLKHLRCSGTSLSTEAATTSADAILSRARDIVAPVRAFATCHCAGELSTLLLAYVLIQKALLLYRQVWSYGTMSSSNYHRCGSGSGGGVVGLPPVHLGAYVVGTEDVLAIYSALLIRALLTVRSLLEALLEKTRVRCGERDAKAWSLWVDVMDDEINRAVRDLREARLQEDLLCI